MITGALIFALGLFVGYCFGAHSDNNDRHDGLAECSGDECPYCRPNDEEVVPG